MSKFWARKFLVESNGNGDWDFRNSTTKVWTMEEIMREINRDSTCTDPYGNVCLMGDKDWPQGYVHTSDCCVMAGSPLDTVDHENNNCYWPYWEDDWEEGWNEGCTEYNRIIREIVE